MHDTTSDLVNIHPDDLNQSGSIIKIIFGMLLGLSVLCANLFAQSVIETSSQQTHFISHATQSTSDAITINILGAIFGMIVCVINIIKFIIDMHDRFIKPTKKKGAKAMPGDSRNPKIEKIISFAKSIIEPSDKSNVPLAVAAFTIAIVTLIALIIIVITSINQPTFYVSFSSIVFFVSVFFISSLISYKKF